MIDYMVGKCNWLIIIFQNVNHEMYCVCDRYGSSEGKSTELLGATAGSGIALSGTTAMFHKTQSDSALWLSSFEPGRKRL